MSDQLCKINICDIDITDERYKISFSQDDITFLAQSIRLSGLTCPPVVRPVNNKYIIISGFNRVRAAVHNNETKTLVYKTKPEISDYQCLLKSITALAFKRPLTHAQLIISTRRLHQFLDKEQIAKKSSAIFSLKLNARFVGDLLNISSLPDPALELIHLGHLSFKSAKRIAFFEKEVIKNFLNIFSKIKASNNKQLEIILHIMEITARDAIKPEIFFKNQELRDILFDENKSPGIKTDDLRAWLFERRFPTIFKTREMVQKKILSIKLGSKIKFLPSQNFEGQDYFISFTAKNYNEFAANVRNLKNALENKELKEILNQ